MSDVASSRQDDAPRADGARQTRTVLAVDPGRAKCGLAVVRGPAPVTCLRRLVVETARLAAEAGALLRAYPEVETVLVGAGTGSKDVRSALKGYFPERELLPVDEFRSSERARARYLLENRPTGWLRLIPRPLRTPEAPYDDYVALILAEEYFERSC